MVEEKTTQQHKNVPAQKHASTQRGAASGGDDTGRRRNTRRRRARTQRSEFDQKIVDIRRVTRVVRGGRRFSFSVALVAGDRKGSVGVGIGKAGDTALAIEKAGRDAKKHMITLKLNKEKSINHDVRAKFAGSEVLIMPAPGKGVVAGSSVRTVLDLAGVKEVGAKLLTRSKNKLNNARAAIKALSELEGTTKKKI